jgi:hypothetical protein
MKHFKRNLQLIDFKRSPDCFYRDYLITQLSFYPKFLVEVDSYFYFLDRLEPKIKLRRNKLRSISMNRDLQESTQFLKILKKNGMYHKYYLELLKVLNLHRSFFERVDLDLNSTYSSYYIFHLFSKTNLYFYSFNFLLNYITNIVDPCLQVKVVTLPKFLQKKYRKRFDFQIKHVDSGVRSRYVYKRVVLNSGFVAQNKLFNRIYSCLLTTILSPKTSLVYTEKVFFYKYALKMYKLGLINMRSL